MRMWMIEESKKMREAEEKAAEFIKNSPLEGLFEQSAKALEEMVRVKADKNSTEEEKKAAERKFLDIHEEISKYYYIEEN